jgi:hypothetical protein
MNMEHKYGNYSVPAPTIEDHFGAVEDAMGGLRVSHSLVASLVESVDHLQAMARMQKIGTIDPNAVGSRLEALWALAISIEERMKDIILLEAVVDQQPQQQLKAA